MTEEPTLDGRVAIVTGASRGIGKALALGLAEAGAAVVCAARTEREAPGGQPGTIHATVDAVRAAGGQALAVRCDIGEAADIEALVVRTLDAYARVDVLVNNATVATQGLFAEMTPEMWDESMRVNVRSLYVSCRAVLDPMRAQGSGSIINLSSGAADPNISALLPPGLLAYSVAKAAVERFSTALALEVADDGIAVNALRPGAVKTEGTIAQFGEDADWTGWDAPEAVVPSVLYLAAQGGDGYTGHILESTQYGLSWP